MKRCILFLALLVCLLVVPASAKDTWTSVRSKNFQLIGNASEKDIRQVATRLEQFRFVFSLLFPKANLTSTVPTTVVVFKNDSSYRPYKPVYGGKVADHIAGYFQPGPDVNYITLTTERREENPYAVIFHEYVHFIVDNNLGDPPTWFNEGLAEYYSTFEIEKDREVLLGKQITNHILLLREKSMRLEDLLRVTRRSPAYNERDKTGVFYAQSWALVHYLLQSNQGQRVPQLGRFSELLANGKSLEESFQQAFQTDFKTMERELQNYVRNNSYRMNVFTAAKPLVFEGEMQSATLTEAEAMAYLGDLLLHSNRLEDAEARLQQSLTLAPDLPMAQASLGMLRVRQNRLNDAREHLRKAVAANSQNYLTHYYYAYALSRDTTAPGRISNIPAETAAAMRAELKKAIELNPRFPEPYYLLGVVSLVTNTELTDAQRYLMAGQTLAPARHDFSLLLAQIYLRKQNFAAARKVLERVVQSANAEEHERANAQALVNQINTIEAQIAEVKKQGGTVVFDNSPAPSSAPSSESVVVEMGKPLIKKRTNGEQVRGMLTRIECTGGESAIFHIKAGERVYKLRAEAMGKLELVAYTQDAGNEITCGLRKPESLVIVTFRPNTAAATRAKFDGDLLAVDFISADMEVEK
ncbi:MAG TPA: tetratricopeptide repeat protein [Pyrinomonadaceae bacterium]|nr:tetratricopeptide repeat protein [Pyrinomonadaceae bacterium]